MNNGNIIRCTFESNTFGDIRVVYDGKEVYFSSRDVGEAFGFREPTKFVSRYCKSIHRFRHETSGGMQTMNFIDYVDVIRLYKYSKSKNAAEFIAYLAKICISLKEADMRVPGFITEEDRCFNDKHIESNAFDESNDYDYCFDCDRTFDDCNSNCDEYFENDDAESETYEAEVFNLAEVLDEVSAMVRKFEEKYGVFVAVEGVYHECPNGERHRVA